MIMEFYDIVKEPEMKQLNHLLQKYVWEDFGKRKKRNITFHDSVIHNSGVNLSQDSRVLKYQHALPFQKDHRNLYFAVHCRYFKLFWTVSYDANSHVSESSNFTALKGGF